MGHKAAFPPHASWGCFRLCFQGMNWQLLARAWGLGPAYPGWARCPSDHLSLWVLWKGRTSQAPTEGGCRQLLTEGAAAEGAGLGEPVGQDSNG